MRSDHVACIIVNADHSAARGVLSAIARNADEMLTAFLELQRAIHGFAVTVSQESVFNDCKAGFANGEVHRI